MTARQASLYRMSTDEHLCPFGLKSRALLKRHGFDVEDHLLRTRREVDDFMAAHGVDTTPQTFIDGERIGGYDDLREYFGHQNKSGKAAGYQPVIAVFAMSLLIALAVSWVARGDILTIRAVEWFVAVSMCVLAILKLQDLEGFSNRFITYDLLGQRVVRYAYVYPFAEAFAGIGMIAGIAMALVIPTALFIGTIGAISVFKAVYIDRRELRCACVGGSSEVPLGFISLTENLMMIAMAVWMFWKLTAGVNGWN